MEKKFNTESGGSTLKSGALRVVMEILETLDKKDRSDFMILIHEFNIRCNQLCTIKDDNLFEFVKVNIDTTYIKSKIQYLREKYLKKNIDIDVVNPLFTHLQNFMHTKLKLIICEDETEHSKLIVLSKIKHNVELTDIDLTVIKELIKRKMISFSDDTKTKFKVLAKGNLYLKKCKI